MRIQACYGAFRLVSVKLTQIKTISYEKRTACTVQHDDIRVYKYNSKSVLVNENEFCIARARLDENESS